MGKRLEKVTGWHKQLWGCSIVSALSQVKNKPPTGWVGCNLPNSLLIKFSENCFLFYFLLKYSWFMCMHAKSLQSHPTLCDPMDCMQPTRSSVHGILQARILEWVAISSSRGSSWPRVWTWVSCIAGRSFTTGPPGKSPELPGKLLAILIKNRENRSISGMK